MKKQFTYTLALLLAVCSLWAFAPAVKNFNGKITYKVTTDLPDGHPAVTMMPQRVIYSVNNELIKMESEPATPGSGTYYINTAAKTMRVAMDIMGKKYQMVLDEHMKQDDASDQEQIRYVPGSRKIAGYDCKKAFVVQEGDSIEVWYTDKITLANGGVQWKKLKGFPMEYKSQQQGITMHFVATQVENKNIKKEELTVPAGYEPIKPEELQNRLMQMQQENNNFQTD